MNNEITKRTIHTCFGCPWYYTGKNDSGIFGYPTKHCGQDHLQCPHYLGTGDPLGKNEKYICFYENLRNYCNLKESRQYDEQRFKRRYDCETF